jgi:hypothetical protein
MYMARHNCMTCQNGMSLVDDVSWLHVVHVWRSIYDTSYIYDVSKQHVIHLWRANLDMSSIHDVSKWHVISVWRVILTRQKYMTCHNGMS